jgi:molybdate transport system permease protein
MLPPETLSVVLLSLRVSAVAILISLPLAIGAAWLLARHDFIGKTLFDALVHLPLVLPPVVIGFVLLALLGRNGPLGGPLHDWFGITLAFRWTGAAVAAAAMAFPLMVRSVRLSFEAIDQRLEIAARTLGAGRLDAFASVTLPLAWPGIAAGATIAFARCLGEFGATITFVSNIPGQTQTLPLAIYTYTQVPGGDAAAWWLCAISVALSVAALAASEALTRKHRSLMRAI